MNKYLFASIVITAFFYSSCNENSVDIGDSDNNVTEDNYVFYKDSTLAEETAEKRFEGDQSDSFEIIKAWFDEDEEKQLMHIVVNQAQGCSEGYTGKYEVIWSGIMLMIYPPQIGFYLKLDTSKCPELKEDVEEMITLDLNEHFGPKDLVDDAVFTILNTSKSSTAYDYELER